MVTSNMKTSNIIYIDLDVIGRNMSAVKDIFIAVEREGNYFGLRKIKREKIFTVWWNLNLKTKVFERKVLRMIFSVLCVNGNG